MNHRGHREFSAIEKRKNTEITEKNKKIFGSFWLINNG